MIEGHWTLKALKTGGTRALLYHHEIPRWVIKWPVPVYQRGPYQTNIVYDEMELERQID